MTQIPDDRRYTRTHEWALWMDDDTVAVGITDHAQRLLGDIVYVELPEVGREVEAEEACAVVESVKAASDIYAPLAGEIVAVNEALQDHPELINQDPYGEGWIFRLRPANPDAFDDLLVASVYEELIAAEEET